jgi:hypothetical protein
MRYWICHICIYTPMSSSSEAPADKNIDWDEVVKKEARGIDDADFWGSSIDNWRYSSY